LFETKIKNVPITPAKTPPLRATNIEPAMKEHAKYPAIAADRIETTIN
jgi:hypothetical protein